MTSCLSRKVRTHTAMLNDSVSILMVIDTLIVCFDIDSQIGHLEEELTSQRRRANAAEEELALSKGWISRLRLELEEALRAAGKAEQDRQLNVREIQRLVRELDGAQQEAERLREQLTQAADKALKAVGVADNARELQAAAEQEARACKQLNSSLEQGRQELYERIQLMESSIRAAECRAAEAEGREAALRRQLNASTVADKSKGKAVRSTKGDQNINYFDEQSSQDSTLPDESHEETWEVEEPDVAAVEAVAGVLAEEYDVWKASNGGRVTQKGDGRRRGVVRDEEAVDGDMRQVFVRGAFRLLQGDLANQDVERTTLQRKSRPLEAIAGRILSHVQVSLSSSARWK